MVSHAPEEVPVGGVCVSILAEDAQGALEKAGRAARLGADLVEYRLDAMRRVDSTDVERLVRETPRPCVVTFRKKDGEGEAERLELLRKAARLGAAYVDIEAGLEGEFGDADPAGLIVSFHDFEGTPPDLPEIARRIESGPADVVKVVTTARSVHDTFAHYEILRSARKPTISFAMGEPGLASRVLCLKFGAPFTFASLEGGEEAAPGQIPLRRMVSEFRAGSIGAETDIYGVIGRPVGHSMSPAMHNAAFRELGLDAVYLPFEVDSDPGLFIKQAIALGVRGLSVTIPHKMAVMEALAEVDPEARKIGAVNTVYLKNGKPAGTNTDLWGAMLPIQEATGGEGSLKGRRALLIGAGGAGRALAFGLREAGAEVAVFDIDPARASRLASDVGGEALGPEVPDPSAFDVVANASPVGMSPNVDAVPIPTDKIRKGQTVFDAVYNPRRTRLLREAASRGAGTVEGIEMFVRQGGRQLELWTGREAPVDTMRRVVAERLGERAR